MANAPATTPGNALALLTRSQRIILAVAIGLSVLAGVLTFTHANAVLIFILSGAALAFLASIVGEATDQLGSRLSPGATGVLQSALGNLPELFVAIFALQQGLLVVVQTSLIGSILGNSLLVLGLALLVVDVALAAILGAVIVFDGESNWLEGLALIGLYVIIAVSFWWG